jgi:hypothetical protein
MITAHQIQRYFHARHFEPLLRGVSPIGLELPMPLRLRLAGQPAAVIALALRRVLEITYGPTALSRELTEALLQMQNDDGSFGAAGYAATGEDPRGSTTAAQPSGDPLATAAAIAAFTSLLREHASAHPEAALARERAIAALAATQAEDGLFQYPLDRTVEDRALAAAFMLALLASDDDVRSAVRYADLMNWFEERDAALGEPTARLWRMACVDAAVPATPVRAAMAA